MSFSIYSYLSEIKEQISKYGNDWDIYKKFTNPYENIYGGSYKNSICKYRPISRAYFKMLEIIDTFNLLGSNNWTKPKSLAPIKMFGIAEGPGGFIEAVLNHRKSARGNEEDVFYGMTIEDSTNDEVPGWRKTRNFLRNNNNVILEKGADGTGNILSMENFKHVTAKYRNSMDIITGDGGFDFSADFNNQELSIHELLFAQVAYAVCMQKFGGSFVLKMFDCFFKPTADILYILTSFYEKVHIIKPNTSRYANSEKYIVCTGFRFSNSAPYYAIFERVMEKMLSRDATKTFISGFLKNSHIPLFLYSKIEECNAIIGQTQIENIHNTLLLIENKYRTDKIDYYLRNHTQKCVNWCIKHGLEYIQQSHEEDACGVAVAGANIFMKKKDSYA
jgi:23S rRNA U2552 (ribose-2'-O)-methylase RlmE/FtsJ